MPNQNKSITSKRGMVPEADHMVPLGEAAVRRRGGDVTIVAYSSMVLHAEAACEELAADGIDAGLIDLRSLVPLDLDTVVAEVATTGRVVVAHEAWTFGGFGAELAAQISERLFGELRAPVARVGARSAPIPFSPPLEAAVVPGKDDVVAAARSVLQG